jgi:hypothetical protein
LIWRGIGGGLWNTFLKRMLRAEGCAEYFLNGPIGNHYIIFCGDYNELFKAFVSVVL